MRLPERSGLKVALRVVYQSTRDQLLYLDTSQLD